MASNKNLTICTSVISPLFILTAITHFGRRTYHKTTVVSENRNENVEMTINDTDKIGQYILTKFAIITENKQ